MSQAAVGTRRTPAGPTGVPPARPANWVSGLAAPADATVPALRRDATASFHEQGFPGPRDEEWRFTPLAAFTQTRFGPALPGRVPTAAEVERLQAGERHWHRLVFLNGRLHAGLSRIGRLPAGTRIGSLDRALRADGAVLDRHLAGIAGFTHHAFTALNTARFEDGACLYVPPGAEIDRPIEFLFLADPDAEAAAIQPRNLIILGANARASIIETFRTLDDGVHFTNAVTEAVVGAGAHLTHGKLGLESEQAFHVGRTVIRHERDSQLTSFAVTMGGRIHRNDLDVLMDGPGCHVTLQGLYMGRGEQLVDNHTSIRHAHAGCASREVYVGVLDDRSHGVFNGKVYVTPEAQQTDGKQTNRNLLLSDRARVDTKPQLEIFADDVKCTHGATVGRLDQAALFYLQSRGIETPLARKILTYAFAAEVLEEIPFAGVRQRLEAMVMSRLDQHAGD
jgi:Fe-S cluster assembly protein SufD